MKSFCIYCGAELTEGAKFCKMCGKPVDELEQEDTNDISDNESSDSMKAEESVRNPEIRNAASEFAASHSNETFEKLYRLTYPKVYSYVSMLTHGNKETAEDVIQSGYLICYDKIDQLQKPENFTAWAKNICYHEYLHSIEKTSHEQLLEDSQSADEETDFFDNIQDEKIEVPEKAAENGELKRLIFKTLDSLPENQRAAVISFYFDDKKISDIAADMNAPENTIKTYLSRAKKNLCSAMSSFADSNGLKLVPVALIPFMAAMFSEKVKACEPAAAQCASSYAKLAAKIWHDAAGSAVSQSSAQMSGSAVSQSSAQMSGNAVSQGSVQIPGNAVSQGSMQTGNAAQNGVQTYGNAAIQNSAQMAGNTAAHSAGSAATQYAAGAAGAAKAAVSVKLIVAVIAAGCAAVVSSGFGAKAYKDMKAQESIEADESIAASEADDNDKMQATDNAAGSTSSTQSSATTTATTAETTTTTETETTESSGDWQEAYRQYLLSNPPDPQYAGDSDNEEDDANHVPLHFMIAYIDGDDIPELITFYTDYIAGPIVIDTYRDGKVEMIDEEYGIWTIDIVEKKGLIRAECSFGTGVERVNYYSLQNSKLYLELSAGSTCLGLTDAETTYYMSYEEDVSESLQSVDYGEVNSFTVDEGTYNAATAKMDNNNYKSMSYSDSYEVNEANLNQYLK